MAKITIKKQAIEMAIFELSSLELSCSKLCKNRPDIVGGGNTVNEMEKIAELLATENKHLLELFLSTISFVTQIQDGFTFADEKIAERLGE